MSDTSCVVAVSPNWLGDAVMALPAIASLKRHFASARLAVAARPSVAAMFTLAPYVDEVVTLSWQGGVLRPHELWRDARAIRGARANVAVILPNSFASAWLVRCANVPERWGYDADLRRPLLTSAVARPRQSVHQGEYYRHLVRSLGVPTGPLEPMLAVPERVIDAAGDLLETEGWVRRQPLVALSPGAAYGTAKQWIPEHFASLMTLLIRERDVACVLVGSRADAATTAAIRASVDVAARGAVIDLAGQTSLEMLAGVLSRARVCVSNDSGAMHLAGALGTSVVGLFGPTREHETAPLTRSGGRTQVLVNPVSCRPCMLRECPIDHRCMAGLLPVRVFATVSEMLGEGSS